MARLASNLSQARVTLDDVEQVYEQQRDRIFRLGLRFFKNVDDAKDLVNETFLQVLKTYHSFRGESALSTWVYEIAIHEALQTTRKRGGRSKRGKRTSVPLTEVLDELMVNPDQEAVAIRRQVHARLMDAFRTLCETCQTLLFLWFYEDMPGRALGAILDLSASETYKKKAACLALLKARVTPTTLTRQGTVSP